MVEELRIHEDHHGFVLPYDAEAHRVGMRTPHRHKELEMNVVVRGRAEYVLSDQRYRLSPGSIVWLFPGQDHLLTKTNDAFKMYVVVFKEQLFDNDRLLKEKYQILRESDPVGSFCRRISLTSIQQLERVCDSLCALNRRQDVTCPAYYYAGQAFGFQHNAEYLHADPDVLNSGLSYLMTMGWHLFATEGSHEKKEVLDPAVEQALQLLKSNSEEELSLADLAMACGTSPTRLSRLFSEQLGVSMVDYKNQLKLEHFLACFDQHDHYNLSEACYAAGFGSYSQFYKIFKQSFGVSPKAYFSL